MLSIQTIVLLHAVFDAFALMPVIWYTQVLQISLILRESTSTHSTTVIVFLLTFMDTL